MRTVGVCSVFFFQAEDGIRDIGVTGVQTCALPISLASTVAVTTETVEAKGGALYRALLGGFASNAEAAAFCKEIGRASCRERGETAGGAVARARPSAQELACTPAATTSARSAVNPS